MCSTCGEDLGYQVRVAAIERVERGYTWYQRLWYGLTSEFVDDFPPYEREQGGAMATIVILATIQALLVLYLMLR